MRPSIGTRSVLYGAHCFFIHPWFVAWGWWWLYGFPWDPRLWVAFFVHDLGYLGKPNMDGPEGETHPILGARIMAALFDWRDDGEMPVIANVGRRQIFRRWGKFALYHSRFYARQHGAPPSRLCYADKMAIVLTPWWLYRWTAGLTGEIDEYMSASLNRGDGKHADEPIEWRRGRERWYYSMQGFLCTWIYENEPRSREASR